MKEQIIYLPQLFLYALSSALLSLHYWKMETRYNFRINLIPLFYKHVI